MVDAKDLVSSQFIKRIHHNNLNNVENIRREVTTGYKSGLMASLLKALGVLFLLSLISLFII